jgi:1-phosphatidylinositol-3-phosphate 5-kinase
VAVEQWDGQIIGLGPTPELTTTWSACRICGSATPFIPVSEEMQRYSFAKFLELHFYPADVQLVQGAGCEHNIYRHHIRYFAKRGMTVRFQADPITLHEIVFPPMRIRVRPEIQLSLKNADYERLMNRNLRWYAALVHDLNLIRMDAATGDEEIDAKLTVDLNQLILRAESERAEVIRMINEIYRDSSPMDTLALNQVRSYLQDKIVAWQADFDKLPKPKGMRADKSGRQASSRFGTIWPGKFDLAGTYDNTIPSSGLSEAEEATPTAGLRRVKGGSFVSTPDASETEGAARTNAAKGAQESEKSKELVTEPPRAFEPAPSTKSDPDSDSTIGASKAGTVTTSGAPEPSTSVGVLTCERLSRHDTVLSRMLGARIAIPFLTWCPVRSFQDAKLNAQV